MSQALLIITADPALYMSVRAFSLPAQKRLNQFVTNPINDLGNQVLSIYW